MGTRYIVAFYAIDRRYGGPEEGGWWYDCGHLVRIHQVFRSREAANRRASRLNAWLKRLQKHIFSVDSAAYRGGRYNAQVYEDMPPKYYPEERPHYE